MESNQLDILELMLNAGLVVKGVVILLFGFSIYTWGIVFKKYSHKSKVFKENKAFKKVFDGYQTIYDVTEEALVSKSVYGKILTSSIQELKKIEDITKSDNLSDHFSKKGITTIERSLENAIATCSTDYRRHNSTLASISSIAPFVGLFGTVWGIINSFQGLAGGGGSVQAVAPGIAEALVATAIGLAAAIPANWFFNKFNSHSSQLDQNMNSFGKEVINLIERSV